jgi:hypothetical protein
MLCHYDCVSPLIEVDEIFGLLYSSSAMNAFFMSENVKNPSGDTILQSFIDKLHTIVAPSR